MSYIKAYNLTAQFDDILLAGMTQLNKDERVIVLYRLLLS